MTKEKILEVKNLQTSFISKRGNITTVDDVSFSLTKGETLAIVGESGCGKSMTALSILGLIQSPGKIVNGEIRFKDKDLRKLSDSEMQRVRGNEISMIFQDPSTSLNPLMKVGKQVSELVRVHKKIDKKAARNLTIDLFKKVGIPHPDKVYDAYPHTLSGGMRQRAMIAMALSCEPELIIADEPTTALDVTIQAQIINLLRKIKENTNTSIIIISHDLGVVAEMADRVLVLYSGQIVEEADIFTLFNEPKHPYTKGLLNSSLTLETDDEAELQTIEGSVPSPTQAISGCKFSNRCPFVMDICKRERPTLERKDDGNTVRCWLYSSDKGDDADGTK